MYYIKHNVRDAYLNHGGRSPAWGPIDFRSVYKFDTALAGFNFMSKKRIFEGKPLCILKHRVATGDWIEPLYELVERIDDYRIKVRAINIPGKPENIFNLEEVIDKF